MKINPNQIKDLNKNKTIKVLKENVKDHLDDLQEVSLRMTGSPEAINRKTERYDYIQLKTCA